MSAQNWIRFFEAVSEILAKEDLHVDNEITRKASENSLSLERSVLGVVTPRSVEQVRKIVMLANHYRVALYPVSQGKNIGYGDMAPSRDHQLVVNLKNLNAIREFDEVSGEVVVEPGVTQAQLAQFLREKNAPYWADVTGASPEASLIGNTLEAGFGHTPLGDHRKHILDMEVVLANGELLTTGEMPSLGPDLAQLFIQSNFGVVTAIRIPLMRIPEKVVSYTLSFLSEEAYLEGLVKLRELRQQGVINSLVHSGNATRTLMTSSRFPSDLSTEMVLNENDCRDILNSRSLYDFGAWTSIGGLYGLSAEVRAKQAKIKKAFKGLAKVQFFSDQKVNLIDMLLNSKFMKKVSKLDLVRSSFESFKALHGIIQGQPSPVPSENIFWRVNDLKKLGLIWYAPVIPATFVDSARLLSVARPIFSKYGFEMPVTMTLINHKKMTVVFNISFDKSNAAETSRAHSAYQELSAATQILGYKPYRSGHLADAQKMYSIAKSRFLTRLKKALDPANTLAPGRYGLSSATVSPLELQSSALDIIEDNESADQ